MVLLCVLCLATILFSTSGGVPQYGFGYPARMLHSPNNGRAGPGSPMMPHARNYMSNFGGKQYNQQQYHRQQNSWPLEAVGSPGFSGGSLGMGWPQRSLKTAGRSAMRPNNGMHPAQSQGSSKMRVNNPPGAAKGGIADLLAESLLGPVTQQELFGPAPVVPNYHKWKLEMEKKEQEKAKEREKVIAAARAAKSQRASSVAAGRAAMPSNSADAGGGSRSIGRLDDTEAVKSSETTLKRTNKIPTSTASTTTTKSTTPTTTTKSTTSTTTAQSTTTSTPSTPRMSRVIESSSSSEEDHKNTSAGRSASGTKSKPAVVEPIKTVDSNGKPVIPGWIPAALAAKYKIHQILESPTKSTESPSQTPMARSIHKIGSLWARKLHKKHGSKLPSTDLNSVYPSQDSVSTGNNYFHKLQSDLKVKTNGHAAGA